MNAVIPNAAPVITDLGHQIEKIACHFAALSQVEPGLENKAELRRRFTWQMRRHLTNLLVGQGFIPPCDLVLHADDTAEAVLPELIVLCRTPVSVATTPHGDVITKRLLEIIPHDVTLDVTAWGDMSPPSPVCFTFEGAKLCARAKVKDVRERRLVTYEFELD